MKRLFLTLLLFCAMCVAKAEPQVREYRAGDTYKIGDIVRRNGADGVVFEVSDGGKHGKMVSVKESSNKLQWASDSNEQNRLCGANNEYNGAYNMAKVKQIADWRYKYPAFAWCADLGGEWYLPAKAELLAIYRNKDVIDKALSSRNGGYLRWWCWSSTETMNRSWFCAWIVDMYRGGTTYIFKYDLNYVRAVSAF